MSNSSGNMCIYIFPRLAMANGSIYANSFTLSFSSDAFNPATGVTGAGIGTSGPLSSLTQQIETFMCGAFSLDFLPNQSLLNAKGLLQCVYF